MVTNRQILEITPFWDEAVELGRGKGREEAREEAREQAREESRRNLLDAVNLVVESKVPGYSDKEWLGEVRDPAVLKRIIGDLLAAPGAEAAQAVLAGYRKAH